MMDGMMRPRHGAKRVNRKHGIDLDHQTEVKTNVVFSEVHSMNILNKQPILVLLR